MLFNFGKIVFILNRSDAFVQLSGALVLAASLIRCGTAGMLSHAHLKTHLAGAVAPVE